MSADVMPDLAVADLDPVLRDGFEVHAAALRRGLNVLLLPRQVMMVGRPGQDDTHDLAFVHGVPSTSTLSAVTFAQDKRMRRASLVDAGLSVPKGGAYSISNGIDDAKRLIKRIGYPVVIKPAMGDNMIEVHAGLHTEAELDEAIDYLRTLPGERTTYTKAAYALTLLGEPDEVDGRTVVPRGYRLLVEKQVPGQYLRFLVVGDQVCSVIHCPQGSADYTSPENRDVMAAVHPSLTEMAVTAAKAVPGLAVVAVDIVVGDYRQDAAEQDAWVVEFSERPWLATQAAVAERLGHELGELILSTHAAESGLELAGPRDDVTVDVHIEGLTNPDAALPTLLAASDALGVTGELTVTDPVEGVADGRLSGDPRSIARFSELMLDGTVGGHRAMLIEEAQRDPLETPSQNGEE